MADERTYYYEAERGILCVIMNNNELIPAARGMLTPADFGHEPHRHIYDAILRLFDSGLGADVITTVEKLKEIDQYVAVGGIDQMIELYQDGYIEQRLDSYLAMVKEKASVRALATAGAEIAHEGTQGVRDASEYLYEARRRILEETAQATGRREVESISSGLGDVVDKVLDGHTPDNLVKTTWSEIDRQQGGLYKGVLTIVAACTGMGKSTFLLNMATNIGLTGHSVLYYTLEDSRRFVQKRMLARLADINLRKLLHNEVMTDDQADRLRSKVRFLKHLEDMGKPLFWINDCPATSDQIAQTALAHRTAHGLDLLLIDHLGYTADKGKDEYTTVSNAVRTFAHAAKDLDIPKVLAVQLNRKMEDRAKVPELKHLRGSGRIEEDARAVWFLHRKPKENPNYFAVHVAKSSHGEVPLAPYQFHCDLSRMFIEQYDEAKHGADIPKQLPPSEVKGALPAQCEIGEY
jgi:replicative DNA helicase